MKVTLLNCTDDTYTDYGLGLCWSMGCYEGEKRKKRITNNALKKKHESVLEQSIACRSSRYTLNKTEMVFEPTGDRQIDLKLAHWKWEIEQEVANGLSNDIASLMLPQAFQYKWISQFNARSLKHFLELRTAPSAHFHIREVALAMFDAIPAEYKYLFEKGE